MPNCLANIILTQRKQNPKSMEHVKQICTNVEEINKKEGLQYFSLIFSSTYFNKNTLHVLYILYIGYIRYTLYCLQQNLAFKTISNIFCIFAKSDRFFPLYFMKINILQYICGRFKDNVTDSQKMFTDDLVVLFLSHSTTCYGSQGSLWS